MTYETALAQLGQDLADAGQFEDAATVFTALAAEQPAAPGPYLALATLAARRGRWPEVAAHAAEALGRDPGSMAARLAHAEALLHLGVYGEAGRDLDALVAATPESDEELAALAWAQALQRRWTR